MYAKHTNNLTPQIQLVISMYGNNLIYIPSGVSYIYIYVYNKICVINNGCTGCHVNS